MGRVLYFKTGIQAFVKNLCCYNYINKGRLMNTLASIDIVFVIILYALDFHFRVL